MFKLNQIRMSMFFRVFRKNDKNFKIFHKYFQLEDNWNEFTQKSPQQQIQKRIDTHQREWNKFVKLFDKQKLDKIVEISSQRFDSSPQTIKEKIGNFYYMINHYYKKDREITQLYEYDCNGERFLIFDPIKDKIMQQKNIQDFVLEKFHFDDDNNLLGILIDKENTEQPTLRIKDVFKNRMLKDRIHNCNDFLFSKNSKYIYYIKLNKNQRPYAVYRHRIGMISNLSDDEIFVEKDDKYFVESILSKSKDFYFLKLSGQQSFKILLANRNKNEGEIPPQFLLINQPKDGIVSIEHTKRGFFFLVQDEKTQKMYFCKQDDFLKQLEYLDENKNDLKFNQKFKLEQIYQINENYVLSEIDFFDDNIIYYTINKGKSSIINQNLKTKQVQEIYPKVDEFGIIKPLTNNNSNEKICQFSFDSVFSCNENFDLNLETNKVKQTKFSKIEGKFFDTSQYKMTEQFYYSFDDQKIPIILIHNKNKDMKNSKYFNKTLVMSYGCYGVPTDIEFDVSLWNYLENNWVIAYPLIRGSSDNGISWHKQTLRKNKFISVQDLIYCFKFLHQSKISHASLIAAQSNSSGAGLLFSAINNQPHLLKACILQVPFLNFLDLLSQKDLPLVGSDIEEFGDPENLEEFKNLLQICPYHNMKQNVYPNILLSCYEQDYRTPLWHILNFVNKFRSVVQLSHQEIIENTKNLFLRINKGSHKGAVSHLQQYKEIAEEFLFLEYSLNEFNSDIQRVDFRLKNLKEMFNQLQTILVQYNLIQNQFCN